MSNSDSEITYCDQHKYEEVTLFCRGCRKLVCNECICGRHDGHRFSLTKVVANDLRHKFTESMETIQNGFLKHLCERQQEIKQLREDYEKNIELVIKDISDRTEDLKIELDKITGMVLAEVNAIRERDISIIQTLEKTVNESLENLNIHLESYREGIQSQYDVEIIELNLKLDTALSTIKNMSLELPHVKAPQFSHGSTNGILLTDLFGKITDQSIQSVKDPEHVSSTDVSRPEEITERKLKISSSFQFFDASSVRSITSNDSDMWIASYNGNTVYRVSKEGYLKNSLDLDIKVYNIAIASDGCLLVVPNKDHAIWKIDPDGECTDFINLEPCYPLGLFVSTTGEVYTGLVDGRPYAVNSNNIRAVLKLSISGSIQKRFECDDSGDHLFIRPQRIVENKEKDVIVLDRTSHNEGRVVSVKETGEKRFVYNGSRCRATQGRFHPGDLCCLDNSHLIISDGGNHILHVLDSNGRLLHYLNPKLECPPPAVSAMAYDSNGYLLLGTSKGTIYVLEYLDI